jgi:hypothetical protein
MPAFSNPSFELQNGSKPGDVAAAIDRPDITPWQTCQNDLMLGLEYVDPDGKNGVNATDGNNYVVFTFLYAVAYYAPVYQVLKEPLRAGQRYAFMIDVRADGVDGQLGLSVYGGNQGCVAVNDNLVMTNFLKEGAWTPTCVTFTPAYDMPDIILLPRAIAGFGAPSRLSIDNIRADPSCK